MSDFNEECSRASLTLNRLRDLCNKEGKRGENLENKVKDLSKTLKNQEKKLRKSVKQAETLNEQYEKNRMLLNEKDKMKKTIGDINLKLEETNNKINELTSTIENLNKELPIMELLDKVYEELGKTVSTLSLDEKDISFQNDEQLVLNKRYTQTCTGDGIKCSDLSAIQNAGDISSNLDAEKFAGDDETISSCVKVENIASPVTKPILEGKNQVGSKPVETEINKNSSKSETELSPGVENEPASAQDS